MGHLNSLLFKMCNNWFFNPSISCKQVATARITISSDLVSLPSVLFPWNLISWMVWGFTSFSKVFQTYQDNGRVNIKDCAMQHHLSHLMTNPTKWHVCPADSDQPGHLHWAHRSFCWLFSCCSSFRFVKNLASSGIQIWDPWSEAGSANRLATSVIHQTWVLG